jgi:S-adenosyl-L-methionine hydrolase (adenosine-forming)
MNSVITLTTDFGLRDHYVGTMKGVILNINPGAQIVDISNSVQPYDLLDGALTLAQAYSYFPPWTIHLVVVDPGVGTARRPIVVDAGNHRFVAPDNGVLSFVFEREERVSVRHITAKHYFLEPVSATFQGRDIFAPVAAYLSKGVEASKFGDAITDYLHFATPHPVAANERTFKGMVMKVDSFGTLITSFRPADVPQLFKNGAGFRILAGKGEVRSLHSTFAEGAPGEVFAIVGSTGFLEIACNRGSAADTLAASRGSDVTVQF